MSKKKKSIKGQKLNSHALGGEIVKLFKRHPKKRFTARQIIKKLKIENNKDSVEGALEKLLSKGKIFEAKAGTYAIDRNTKTSDGGLTEGVVDMTRQGDAFVITDDLSMDIHVSARKLNSALDGDRVRVQYYFNKTGKKPEGEVMTVVERRTEHFIGDLQLSKNFGFVIPDNYKAAMDIYVPLEEINGAKNGDKVIVKVTQWASGKMKSPVGTITASLGQEGDNEIAMKSILVQKGFDLSFPKEVWKESEALGEEISEDEIAKRRDFRTITTFTIDPDTAKDFDDALSLEYLENGDYEIGVHIADVTHYVRPKTELDNEAYRRSTSVYLVDRVSPMLPEKLSNGLCSLRPNEDKLTFSAVFTFDKNDKITKKWFGKTIIHSDRRFTYEEAQERIESGEGDFASEIRKLNRVALKLRKAKFKKGAIAFESPEVKFKLDEDGTPLYVYVKERKEAHMMIEDFMLLANKEVAKYIYKKGKDAQEVPFVYRVHDLPGPDKLGEFARFAAEMGFKMDLSTPQQIAKSFNRLALEKEKHPQLEILAPLAIRTMAKAEYTTENIGHYGLAFEFYAHFTSPIRRYADVLVHRILEKNLDGTYRENKAKLEAKCKHISQQERKAMEAERESVKYKQVEFMENHIGDEFDGLISGMIDRGFFVEIIENRCEGLIGFEQLNEGFALSEGRMKATGRKSGRVIKMGDTVRVKITGTDLSRRLIDMELVSE